MFRQWIQIYFNCKIRAYIDFSKTIAIENFSKRYFNYLILIKTKTLNRLTQSIHQRHSQLFCNVSVLHFNLFEVVSHILIDIDLHALVFFMNSYTLPFPIQISYCDGAYRHLICFVFLTSEFFSHSNRELELVLEFLKWWENIIKTMFFICSVIVLNISGKAKTEN